MDTLRVRAYNVLFGDAILISVPDRNPSGEVMTRHILIDVGNVLATQGGVDSVFKPVVENILEELDGQPLGLYVMTHEHMDHVQGLLYAARNLYSQSPDELRMMLHTQYAWLTASAAPNYYEDHPSAKQKLQIYESIETYLNFSAQPLPPAIQTLMLNNNPRSTADCVEYLRHLADDTSYVYRGFDITGRHPFQEARLEIWAPEEDTTAYYGRFAPMTLGVTQSAGSEQPTLSDVIPPPGVDAGAFYNLVAMRRGYVDNLLAIDQAANNSSVVFYLEWRNWRLLFTGDAEERSWKEMDKNHLLRPIHFLKVSHHGSHNGTPDSDLLDKLLPLPRPDQQQRYALVSTFPNEEHPQDYVYNNVPDQDTLKALYDANSAEPPYKQRCDQLYDFKAVPPGGFVDIKFKDVA
jgi:hypothetical protein